MRYLTLKCRRIIHPALIIAIILFPALLRPVAHADTVTVGEKVPNFVLMDEDGKNVDMESLLDKPTLIYFTHNACHYCTQIIAHLKRAETKFGRTDFGIFGINVMAKDKKLVKAYKEELDFTFPMLAGNRWDVLKAFKIAYVPVLVFIDVKKIVRNVVGHYIHEPELHKNIREIMGQ